MAERLKQIHMKFYPPSLTFEVEKNGEVTESIVDLQQITIDTDPEELAETIMQSETVLQEKHRAKLVATIKKLIKMQGVDYNTFELSRIHKAHEMPLTDCSFNKMGELFITASNDRTCRVWETESGKQLHCLSGHTNAVYCCRFNNPIGNLVATGSSDKTAIIWDVNTGNKLYQLSGHSKDVVAVQFDHESHTIVTASLDATARIYDVETGQFHVALTGHKKDVTHVEFSQDDEVKMTSSSCENST